jgi:hypothetical protein
MGMPQLRQQRISVIVLQGESLSLGNQPSLPFSFLFHLLTYPFTLTSAL